MNQPDLILAVVLGVAVQAGSEAIPLFRRRAWRRTDTLIVAWVSLVLGVVSMFEISGAVRRGDFDLSQACLVVLLGAVGGAAIGITVLVADVWLPAVGPLDLIPRSLVLWAVLVAYASGEQRLWAVIGGAILTTVSFALVLNVNAWTVRRSVTALLYLFAMGVGTAAVVGSAMVGIFSTASVKPADPLVVSLIAMCLVRLGLEAIHVLALVPFGSRTQSLSSQLRSARAAAALVGKVWAQNGVGRIDVATTLAVVGGALLVGLVAPVPLAAIAGLLIVTWPWIAFRRFASRKEVLYVGQVRSRGSASSAPDSARSRIWMRPVLRNKERKGHS